MVRMRHYQKTFKERNKRKAALLFVIDPKRMEPGQWIKLAARGV